MNVAASGTTAVAVGAYMRDLAARLRGPRKARARVLEEISDGIADAIHAYLARGMAPDAAAAAAIGEFGDPAAVASSFAGELVTASARRTIAAFVATGPLVGIGWLLLLRPAPWRAGPAALLIAIPALPVVALAMVTAAGAFATTGRLIRWLPEATPAGAVAAATIVAALCLVVDLSVLVVLAVRLVTGWHPPAVLAGIATTVSLLRISAATVTVQAYRRLRHWLTRSERA
jgi:hypothetical protein